MSDSAVGAVEAVVTSVAESVIETTGLTKYYGARAAVECVDLRIPRGTVYGLVGRNGSGKTTIIKMLLGLLRPTRGRSTVLGRDSQDLDPAARARIGYLPEGHPFYGWMRVRGAGQFVSSFYESWNADAFARLIEYFELDPKQRVKQLSRGQRAQVSLALVLAQEPELLVMDDPAMGLDAVVRREFLESVIELIKSGDRTVVMSSHQLGDVERVADRIAVIDRGVVRADCSVDTFRAKVKRVHLTFAGAPPELPDIPGIVRTAVGEREVALTIANFDDSVLEQLRQAKPESVEVEDLGLEDAFVDYTTGGERTAHLSSVLGTDPRRRTNNT